MAEELVPQAEAMVMWQRNWCPQGHIPVIVIAAQIDSVLLKLNYLPCGL